MEDDTGAARLASLKRGRAMLLVAAAGALVAVLGTMANKPVLSVVGWVAATLGGWGGLDQSAAALGLSKPVKLVAMLGALMPGLNLPLLAGFAWFGHRGVAGLEEETRRAAVRERRARRAAEPANEPAPKAGAAPPAGAAAARAGLRKAVACVKQITDSPTRDGLLETRFSTGTGLLQPTDRDQPLARACAGHLIAFYLIDDGPHLRYATHGDLAAEKMGADELHALALRNLAALVEGPPGLRMGREGAMNALLMGGLYEASLVLLDSLWDGPLAKLAPNGAVVALPARDICAFCDARSAEGVAQLRALAQKVSANGDHLVTPRLLSRQGGRWSPLPA